MKRILCILLFSSTLFAGEVKIFLKPTMTLGDEIPQLSDIAEISGTSDSIADIRLARVHTRDLRDGFIDKGEVERMLGSFEAETIVYGSGVRILPQEKIDEPLKPMVQQNERVTVLIKRKGVSVETIGTASHSAKLHEKVSIRLKNNTRITGVVTGKNTVEAGS